MTARSTIAQSGSSRPLRLLAKSCHDWDSPPHAARYVGHTVAVVRAAEILVAERGHASLQAAGLPKGAFDRLRRIVLLAAFIHDLGKASEHFQLMVRRKGDGQLVRHEAVSAWLAWEQPLHDWLQGGLIAEADLPLVIAAAAGHHRKFAPPAINTDLGLGNRVRVFTGHDDVANVLTFGGRVLNLGEPPELNDCELVVPRGGDRQLFRALSEALNVSLRSDTHARALLAIAKALVLNADVAGSAIPRRAEQEDWIVRQLSERATEETLRSLLQQRLQGKALRPFQQMVAEASSPITLVEAGCGNGKTLAAYAWFTQQHVGRQLWVTYPTTGTALEGFRGYLRGIDDLQASLESSRREIDLELCSIEEPSSDDGSVREEHRLESLRAWGQHAIACTVDTVLGLIQNQRKGLYAWVGLVHGAVVFDEIHAYDDRLFGSLLQFLRRLPGIPVLLMTASLPTHRREILQGICREIHGVELPIIKGDEGLETLKRYQFVDGDPWERVKETLEDGGKVLWVSNTVARCLERAKQAAAMGLNPLIYHSRFRYVDRVQRHAGVIAAFSGSSPCVAMTTQVAEMSLDLSADLLVTDEGPVSALIQRLGRLNRRSTPDHYEGTKPAIVLPVGNEHLPYEAAELVEARAWREGFAQGTCSQRDLVDAWQPIARSVRCYESAWFDGALDTLPASLREDSYGITVLIEGEDADISEKNPPEAVRRALPMPPPKDRSWLNWRRVQHLLVAPKGMIEYDEHQGGRWVA